MIRRALTNVPTFGLFSFIVAVLVVLVVVVLVVLIVMGCLLQVGQERDRKSTRLNSSHSQISYAVFCLKKKKKKRNMAMCRRLSCQSLSSRTCIMEKMAYTVRS